MKSVTRREFMVDGSILIGGAVGGLALGNELFFPQKVQAGKVGFPESSCGLEKKTGKKVLIAYASRCGTTGGVAEAIGKVLCDRGAVVDVRLVGDVNDLSPYHAMIVGSAIRMGKWLPEAAGFVKNNQDTLHRLPIAYFVVCLTMKDNTAENRSKALAYLDPVRKEAPRIQPVATGLFPGAMNFNKLSLVHKTILKAKGASEGDYRDWTAIRTWAEGLSSPLLALGGKRYATR
jgi:menaquinone-dependent protoporphyrinogen oxidase